MRLMNFAAPNFRRFASSSTSWMTSRLKRKRRYVRRTVGARMHKLRAAQCCLPRFILTGDRWSELRVCEAKKREPTPSMCLFTLAPLVCSHHIMDVDPASPRSNISLVWTRSISWVPLEKILGPSLGSKSSTGHRWTGRFERSSIPVLL